MKQIIRLLPSRLTAGILSSFLLFLFYPFLFLPLPPLPPLPPYPFHLLPLPPPLLTHSSFFPSLPSFFPSLLFSFTEKRQAVLFSATQTRNVEDLARISLKKAPLYVGVDDNKETSTVEGLEQVREKEKGAMGGGGSVELGGVEKRGGRDPILSQSSLPFFLPAITTSNLEKTKSSSYRVNTDSNYLLQICSPLPFPPSLSLPPSTNTCTGVCSVSFGAAFSATVHVPQEKPE